MEESDLASVLRTSKKKKIKLEEIDELYACGHDYNELTAIVGKLMQESIIQPVKASKTNGKYPPLFKEYKITVKQQRDDKLIEEMRYRLSTRLDMSYYLKHYEQYVRDREYVTALSSFLDTHQDLLAIPVSGNERSFQIWNQEKFLLLRGGKNILKNVGLTLSDINIYETSEPLAYYSHNKNVPQNILIVENKDTFYSIRKFMISKNGRPIVFGIPTDTVIYGAGKGILRSYRDFAFVLEDYLTDDKNTLFYFGDMDYEGIHIYEDLYRRFEGLHKLQVFVPAYLKMLEKAEKAAQLPDSKENQNDNIADIFMSFFEKDAVEHMYKILRQGQYIPQEILNISDFNEER